MDSLLAFRPLAASAALTSTAFPRTATDVHSATPADGPDTPKATTVGRVA
ncbi:MAG: hypothetical protein LC104_21995 [Bacteroidales bacterium]|nr:hypothetical protein [Bacteroidales bacterium]